jgi:hypothetical protein
MRVEGKGRKGKERKGKERIRREGSRSNQDIFFLLIKSTYKKVGGNVNGDNKEKEVIA